MGTLHISFKCLLLQRFPPWWKGCVYVCACACMCVCVCFCACACVCLCGRETMITVTLRGVTEAAGQPLLARCESQPRQARATILSGFVTCKRKNFKRPRSQACFCHFGLSHSPALRWGGVDPPTSCSGTERGRAPSGCFGSRPSATARGQKGPTGFCALVCD